MIAVFIMLILFCGGIIKKRSRTLTYLMLVYMWIFYALNTYSGDYISYKYVYTLIEQGKIWGHFEPGFTLLMLLCIKIGLPFLGFKSILATIYILGLFKTIKTYTKNTAFALAIFMIFPFMYFASVLRAGIAGLIIVYAIQFLKRDVKHGDLKYIGYILSATMVHSSSLFFLLFLLIRKGAKKGIMIRVMGVALMIDIFFRNTVLFKIIGMFTKNYKILQWLNGGGHASSELNITGKVIQIIILLSILFVTRQAYKINYSIRQLDSKQDEICEIVLKCNAYMLTLIPVMMMTDVWIRLVWEILLLNICTYSNTIELIHCLPQNHNKKYAVSCFELIVIAMILFIYIYMDKPYWGTENASVNMFYNNIIFSKLSL